MAAEPWILGSKAAPKPGLCSWAAPLIPSLFFNEQIHPFLIRRWPLTQTPLCLSSHFTLSCRFALQPFQTQHKPCTGVVPQAAQILCAATPLSLLQCLTPLLHARPVSLLHNGALTACLQLLPTIRAPRGPARSLQAWFKPWEGCLAWVVPWRSSLDAHNTLQVQVLV